MINIRSYPTWDALYRDANVKDLPWYNNKLDSDLDHSIIKRPSREPQNRTGRQTIRLTFKRLRTG